MSWSATWISTSLLFMAFVGVKMILSNHYPISDVVSMSIIVGILLVGVLASARGSSNDSVPLQPPLGNEDLAPRRLGACRSVLF